jgi:hypothetical protein
MARPHKFEYDSWRKNHAGGLDLNNLMYSRMGRTLQMKVNNKMRYSRLTSSDFAPQNSSGLCSLVCFGSDAYLKKGKDPRRCCSCVHSFRRLVYSAVFPCASWVSGPGRYPLSQQLHNCLGSSRRQAHSHSLTFIGCVCGDVIE